MFVGRYLGEVKGVLCREPRSFMTLHRKTYMGGSTIIFCGVLKIVYGARTIVNTRLHKSIG